MATADDHPERGFVPGETVESTALVGGCDVGLPDVLSILPNNLTEFEENPCWCGSVIAVRAFRRILVF